MVWGKIADWGGRDAIVLRKVKGHATRASVQSGAANSLHKAGNDLADEYAKQAASFSRLPQDIREGLDKRSKVLLDYARWVASLCLRACPPTRNA